MPKIKEFPALTRIIDETSAETGGDFEKMKTRLVEMAHNDSLVLRIVVTAAMYSVCPDDETWDRITASPHQD